MSPNFKHLFLLSGLLVWLACQNAAEQTSLPDDKIAHIMADLCVAEAATNGLSGYAKDSLTHAYYTQVMELHGVTIADYEKNLHILANDLPRMHRLLDQVDLILDPKKADKEKPEEKEN